MKPLTSLERRTLHLAARKGGVVPVKRKGDDDRAVTTATANRVVLAGWATLSNGVLLISKAGRAKLNEPIPEDPDVFLREGDGLTTSRKDALLAEGPILDPATLDGYWNEQAELKKAETRDAREHAKTLRRATRNWPTQGPCGPVVRSSMPDAA